MPISVLIGTKGKIMSRPDFLDCPMTPGIIRGIREKQEQYDKDPKGWEQNEKERKEQLDREEYERDIGRNR